MLPCHVVFQTILGCEGDDLAAEMVLFHYQMDILKTEKGLEQ
jgi:hypothetical protein